MYSKDMTKDFNLALLKKILVQDLKNELIER